MSRILVFVWAAVLAGPGVSFAQTPARLQIPRVSAPPRFEDFLPGGAHPGVKVTDFRQREPQDLAPATEKTAAYLSYDDTNLYVAFVCDVSKPAELRAHMSKRETIFSDDVVGIILDTFFDHQRAYEFFANPLGIQLDGITSEGTNDDFNFDTNWHSRGQVTDSGYVVWMAIPFKSLRFPVRPDGAQTWGVAVLRLIPAHDETSFWPGITGKVSGFASQLAVMEGLSGISPGRNIQLIPYGTFTGARVIGDGARAYTKTNDARGGLDAKMVVRDAVTVDLTANPDFSQVESDEPQVTVNQRFEVFFPEKRPFFLENADFFQTPQTLFFSRRIRDPQLGARVTGKFGQFAVGGIVMDDRAPGRLAAAGDPGAGARAYNGVVRGRFDFKNQSTVGGMVTTRSFGPTSNQVYSADARIRLSSTWFASGQAVGSSTRTGTGDRLTGAAISAMLAHSTRTLEYNLAYSDASPDFRTELGFVPRLDYRKASSFLQYRWRPKTGRVIAFGPNSLVEATWNYAGALQDWVVRFPFGVDFKGQTSIFARHAILSEKIAGIDLRQREDSVQVGTSYLRWLAMDAGLSHGTRPNYAPASGPPLLGDFTDLYLGFTLRPTSALMIGETIIYSRLDSRPSGAAAASANIFSNRIVRSRVNYQFSRDWSLRAILDYNTLTPDPALVALNRSRRAAADVLLTWLAHPGTALYLGYTDGYDNVRLDPIAGLQPTPRALASTGRQVFVKMSWLFRF